MKAKDQAIDDLKVRLEQEETQSQAKQAQLDQIFMLQWKQAESPISGGAKESIMTSEGNSFETSQQLVDKNKKISQLITKQQELEKMLEDRDD